MSEPILKLPLRCDGQEIFDARNILIAQIWSNDPFSTLKRDSVRACEIIRRVNAFDTLLAACKLSEEFFRVACMINPSVGATPYPEIRDAITTAEKEVS